MVHRVSGETFQRVVDSALDDEHGVFVHGLSDKVPTSLVLFAHGLNGHRYKTWENFPEFLLQARTDLDVGLYGYTSGIKRYARRDMVDLGAQAQHFASQLRMLEYHRIVLVGHSMGGLLCMGAVRELLEDRLTGDDPQPAIDRISGLFLLATPLAGSLRVRWPLSWTVDGKVLRAHSDYVGGLHRTFADRVEMNGRPPSDHHKIWLPTFSASATLDRLVDKMSSRLGVPASQCTYVRGSHTSIVKPRSPGSDIFTWFCSKLDRCLVDPEGGPPPLGLRVPTQREGGQVPGGTAPKIHINITPDQMPEVVRTIAALRLEEETSIDINILPREGD
ncbi:hypothetical protein ACWT_3356 [Actinoplanes sp. SE50]|nr:MULTISPECIES: alpha/beta fold hydrolase [unclassified Actinoplanes]AEV84379.1 hypothetical protein ACPL_3484 [Actinoplanes sp. SE50/110]ATO82771.1 hypothetical protein ACWT_3356 [Actinoplanes sp. SE50]SLM00178.1 hypothetical protein ACSP50_3410 [Actinoplanes sp. SE50/110]